MKTIWPPLHIRAMGKKSFKEITLTFPVRLQSLLQRSQLQGTSPSPLAPTLSSPATSSAPSPSTSPGCEQASMPAWTPGCTSWPTFPYGCRVRPRIMPAGTSALLQTKEAWRKSDSMSQCKVTILCVSKWAWFCLALKKAGLQQLLFLLCVLCVCVLYACVHDFISFLWFAHREEQYSWLTLLPC